MHVHGGIGAGNEGIGHCPDGSVAFVSPCKSAHGGRAGKQQKQKPMEHFHTPASMAIRPPSSRKLGEPHRGRIAHALSRPLMALEPSQIARPRQIVQQFVVFGIGNRDMAIG